MRESGRFCASFKAADLGFQWSWCTTQILLDPAMRAFALGAKISWLSPAQDGFMVVYGKAVPCFPGGSSVQLPTWFQSQVTLATYVERWTGPGPSQHPSAIHGVLQCTASMGLDLFR